MFKSYLPAVFGAGTLMAGCYPLLGQAPHWSLSLPPEAPDTLTPWVQSQLNAAGVTNVEIDRGCYVIDYNRPGPNGTLVNERKGSVEPCEVYETALDRYEADPSNDTFRTIVEGFAGSPLPWELDDHDPKTAFDVEIRRKVFRAIFELGRILTEAGKDPTSAVYDFWMAYGLYHFVAFPEDSRQDPEPGVWANKTVLQPFADFLLQKGGLGVSLIVEDAPVEATALEALKTKTGYCTEQSNILYAVFRLAGLKPFFVSAKGRDIIATVEDLKQKRMTPEKINEARQNGHVFIGVSIGTKALYFDLAQSLAFVDYPSFYPSGLNNHLAGLMNNRGSDLIKKGDLKEARSVLRQSIRLDPQPGTWNNLGTFLDHQGDQNGAIEAYRKAIDLDEEYAYAWTNLGIAHYLRSYPGDNQRASDCFKRSLQLNPLDKNAQAGLMNLEFMSGAVRDILIR